MKISNLLPFFDKGNESRFDRSATSETMILVSRKKIIRSLFLCVSLFFVGHMIEAFVGTNQEFRLLQLSFWTDLNREFNVPTLFTCFLLISSSILLAIIAIISKVSDRKRLRYWSALSFIFLLLAIDELLSFHDSFNEVMWPILQTYSIRVRFFFYPWVIIGVVLLSLFLLTFSRFLIGLPSHFRNAFILSGFIYVGGAIGLEMINGAWLSMSSQDLTYDILTGVEESLEMSGIVIFIYTLLTYLETQSQDLKISITTLGATTSSFSVISSLFGQD